MLLSQFLLLSYHLHSITLTRVDSDYLPVLVDGDVGFHGTDAIFAHLQSIKVDLDGHLSAKEKADNLAFCVLLQERVYRALLHSMWMDDENYETTRRMYSQSAPFPLSRLLPWAHKRTALGEVGRTDATELMDQVWFRGNKVEAVFGLTM